MCAHLSVISGHEFVTEELARLTHESGGVVDHSYASACGNVKVFRNALAVGQGCNGKLRSMMSKSVLMAENRLGEIAIKRGLCSNKVLVSRKIRSGDTSFRVTKKVSTLKVSISSSLPAIG